jgi:hypothetical protein
MPSLITTPPRCNRKHCERLATQALVLNVPAKDCPIAEHDPIRIIMRLPLCDACLKSCNAGEFLSPMMRGKPNPLRKVILTMTVGMGKAPPDFKRSFVTGILLESEEFKAFDRSR